jgi:hypothetical protein
MPATASSVIPQDGKAIVLFSAEWCGHCKAMKSDWTTFQNSMKTRRSDIQVVNVDAAELKGTNISVNGFPTIYAFNNGEKVDEFDNDRSVEGFSAFAKDTFPQQQSGGGRRKNTLRRTGGVRSTTSRRCRRRPQATARVRGRGRGRGRGQKGGGRMQRTRRTPLLYGGGGEYAPVNSPATVPAELQWTSSQTSVPPAAYNGGLYGGLPFAGPWGTVPVPATTGYHINKNLVSAEPPPGATTQYPGTERLGNNYSGMTGANWFEKGGQGPYNIQCATTPSQSGGGGGGGALSSNFNALMRNANHMSSSSSSSSATVRRRRQQQQHGGA